MPSGGGNLGGGNNGGSGGGAADDGLMSSLLRRVAALEREVATARTELRAKVRARAGGGGGSPDGNFYPELRAKVRTYTPTSCWGRRLAGPSTYIQG